SDAYLIKPVTSRELVAMARALLRAARAERRSHEHQRAAEELRRRVAQSKAMVDVARSITASLDLQGVLGRTVDEACLLRGARAATPPSAPHERPPVWAAALLPRPAPELAPPTRAIIEAEGYRAVLSVPLLAGDRALGAIVVYRDLVGPFSEDDIDITQVFAA